MIVGVLDLQGDVIEHRRALEACGAQVILVKTPTDLEKVDALVMPGGESTTIGKLMNWNGLTEPLRKRIREGMPVYGTCAGAILLSKKITGKETAPNLGLMDIEIERNAYGRQVNSFETSIEVALEDHKQSIPAVFIRAPKIKSVGQKVKVLAQWDGEIVLAQEENMLVSTFHPELTNNLTIHRYFLTLVNGGTHS